ncbi:MAG: hypothetical protein P9X24_12035 [Candidatus Hatepunaea meridiana]|nr:hypothetical protein [Candidatus Hatepunaea meridiana]
MKNIPSNLGNLLKLAQDGDEKSLNELLQRFEPGLIILVKNSLHNLPQESQCTIVNQTLTEFRDKIQQVKSSPKGFIRTLLHSRIMNLLLEMVKKGEKMALNELIAIMDVRLLKFRTYKTGLF